MAENLFEKYGIKEVADVTLSRIDREDVTYESHSKISISSVLKDALVKQVVYPIDENGNGEQDGYEAYVFKDADILTHFNYDCDDVIKVKGTAIYLCNGKECEECTCKDEVEKLKEGDLITSSTPEGVYEKIKKALTNNGQDNGKTSIFNPKKGGTVILKDVIDVTSGRDVTSKIPSYFLNGHEVGQGDVEIGSTITYNGTTDNVVTADEADLYAYKAEVVPETYSVTLDDLNGRLPEGLKYDGSLGEKLKFSGCIYLGAPYNATGDDLRDAFALQQKALYESLGIILRFKQIERTDELYSNFVKEKQADEDGEGEDEEKIFYKFTVPFTATLSSKSEKKTGIYDFTKEETHWKSDADLSIGTHEFSYQEQICMRFAKNQNLITKAGTRYTFSNPDDLFGAFDFDDNFVTAPNGRERVVVVGLAGKISENLYDMDEINEALKTMKDTLATKAYVIGYSDYAELVVEDEMGYYVPQQLGYEIDRKTGAVTFFKTKEEEAAAKEKKEETPKNSNLTYAEFAKKKRGLDTGILNAVQTWGDEAHYSINDAIDALKQQKQLLDATGETRNVGFDKIFGGYLVRGRSNKSSLPLDDDGRGAMYEDYTINGKPLNDVTGKKLSSSYALQSVIDALSIAQIDESGQLRVTSTAETESNRAIYVDTVNNTFANSAYIYVLHNIKNRGLANDTDGIFEFNDKKGNRLYYQDKVFKGTEYLALVVIGTRGLIFVVNRHSTKNFEQSAWMVNDNGYLTDTQAARLVKHGLIHTVTVTACGESFDATCTVKSIKVRKIKKNVVRYTPVLYLDSLKVSTLEQATETTSATGGRGNSKLMTWDYGKEITLSIEDALYSPALMAAIWGGADNGDFADAVKDAEVIDRFEKFTAERNFIVPAGNHNGAPVEGDNTPQAVYYDLSTMQPFQDGTPIAKGDLIGKLTRSVSYNHNSLGKVIEISADGFPGTYRVMGETLVKDKKTGKESSFQFIIPEAKMTATDTSITLEADGDPTVFSFSMDVLRPEDGVMMRFVQFETEKNKEENDGSTKIKDTETLNLLDEAEMYKVSGDSDEELVIGATEY